MVRVRPADGKRFSVGLSTDYRTVSLLVSGIGSIGTAINIIATILCMCCPGMTFGKTSLLVWMNLVIAGLVIRVLLTFNEFVPRYDEPVLESPYTW